MAYIQETASDAGRNPRSQQIIKRLHSLREHAEQVRAMSGVTADKIMGPEPQTAASKPAGTAGTVALPNGFFADAEQCIEEIARQLGYASDNLRRFEGEF